MYGEVLLSQDWFLEVLSGRSYSSCRHVSSVGGGLSGFCVCATLQRFVYENLVFLRPQVEKHKALGICAAHSTFVE